MLAVVGMPLLLFHPRAFCYEGDGSFLQGGLHEVVGHLAVGTVPPQVSRVDHGPVPCMNQEAVGPGDGVVHVDRLHLHAVDVQDITSSKCTVVVGT